MTETLAIVPMLVVLVTGATTLFVRRWPRLQRALTVTGTLVYAATVAALVRAVVFAPDGGAIAYQVGGWRAPFGITLVADGLSVFMLAMTAVLAVYAVVFSLRYVDEANQRVYYYPLLQFLLLGVTGAFLTGDLFNLFVWFEVMLMVSYVFVSFYGDARHTAAAVRYVVLNVVGGVFMLLGIGGLYATTGTLNMADMARQLSAGGELAPVVGLSVLVFVTFALKAGLAPFQFWVPSAYRAAPLPVVALFAGVTKKVGIYAIIRLYFTVFGNASVTTDVPGIAGDAVLSFVGPVLLVMGGLSILLGGVGAVDSERLDGLFAYSSVGQVGFIAVALGVAAVGAGELRHLGVLAALVFALHHALTKGLLFLSTGIVRDTTGTTTIADLGGFGERSPVFAGAFFVGSLSLVGIPPLAGFFGKLFVFDAAATRYADAATAGATAAVGAGLVVVLLLVGAVLTVLYATRAWSDTVWGGQTDAVRSGSIDTVAVAIVASLAVLVVALGIGFEPVYEFADTAAEAALDTEGYVELVDPGGDET
jgi:multicomponent Na+:H+ antiporter subunit D